MHVATRVAVDYHMNHDPEITLVLKGWGRPAEVAEHSGNRMGVCNHQLVVPNLANLERTPILDDTIVAQWKPVLFTRSLRRRTNDLAIHAGVLAKDHTIGIGLREFLRSGRELPIADPNVFQSPNRLFATRKIGILDGCEF